MEHRTLTDVALLSGAGCRTGCLCRDKSARGAAHAAPLGLFALSPGGSAAQAARCCASMFLVITSIVFFSSSEGLNSRISLPAYRVRVWPGGA